MYVFAIIGGVIAVWRIWQNLNKLRQRKNDSWDARLIDQLRKRGSDPFKPHDVDFFLAFPDARSRRSSWPRSCAPKASTTDVIDTPESGELRYSLHAHKSHAAHGARHAGPEPAPDRCGERARAGVTTAGARNRCRSPTARFTDPD